MQESKLCKKIITSGSYIRASAGTNCADDALIRTKKECIVAGVQLVETKNTRDRPSGCFYNNLYGLYYWNEHLDTSLSRPQKFGHFVGLCINKGAIRRQNGQFLIITKLNITNEIFLFP